MLTLDPNPHPHPNKEYYEEPEPDTRRRRLEALKNRYTRYECIAENAAGERVLLAYSMRTGRRALLESAQKHGPQLIAWLKIGPEATLTFRKPAKLGAQIGPASIRFSGRTQREAILAGEHPFIGGFPQE